MGAEGPGGEDHHLKGHPGICRTGGGGEGRRACDACEEWRTEARWTGEEGERTGGCRSGRELPAGISGSGHVGLGDGPPLLHGGDEAGQAVLGPLILTEGIYGEVLAACSDNCC